jgi:hypothetical protein
VIFSKSGYKNHVNLTILYITVFVTRDRHFGVQESV